MPLLISDYFMQMAERFYGDAAATERERGAATLARWISGSDRRNSTCDVYNVRSSRLAGGRQSRSGVPPECSWKPHCTMSVFVLLVFCLLATLGVCQQVAGEETMSPAECFLSGQEAAARWLDDHPKWELDKARCSLGNRRVANNGEI
jgi:hypothetical protein